MRSWGEDEMKSIRKAKQENTYCKKRQELYRGGLEYSFCFMFVHWRSQGQDRGDPVTPLHLSDISSSSCLNKQLYTVQLNTGLF